MSKSKKRSNVITQERPLAPTIPHTFEYFYHGVDGNYSDDGDGGDKAKDDGDIIIVSKQRLVKRPLVTEWCLDEDSGEELPLVQNLETYSALQRL